MKILSSGLKGASAVIRNKPCFYCGYALVSDSTKNISLTVWNSEDATTTNDTEVGHYKSNDYTQSATQIFPTPIWCSNGIYAQLSAEEGDYIIYYSTGY